MTEIDLTEAEVEALREIPSHPSFDSAPSVLHNSLVSKGLIKIVQCGWEDWCFEFTPAGRALVERLEGEHDAV